jgi:hypothetical protein
MATVLMFTGSASAATVVGSNCAATTSPASVTAISLRNPPGYPLPSAIPSAGVITSWTFSIGAPLPPESRVEGQLKVFAPTGLPDQFKVGGESALSAVGAGLTTIPTRIPVQSGDLLGSTTIATVGGKTGQYALICETKDEGDEIGLISGDPGTGTIVSPETVITEVQNPVTVTVEPDADGDGYGDETQDKCPTDASTQGPCPAPPAPPAPITLSASAAAKKGLVTVSLTSSAQASVTVGGTVKLGKGKTAELSGGTQTVTPGVLAKFTVLFPAKLKARLKQLPPSQKLTLSLSASAPGATTTSLTVKLPGQKKAPRHRHHKA